MTNDEALLPCPFCGETPIIKKTARWPRVGHYSGRRMTGYSIICDNFNCIIYDADSKYWSKARLKDAIAAWNRRV